MNTESATANSDASVEDRIEQILFDEQPADDLKQSVQPKGDATDGNDDQEDEDAIVDDAEAGTLAAYLGINEDQIIETDDGKVLVNVKVNGEVTPVPMQEVIASYQLQKHVNNKSMILSEQLKTVQSEYQTVRTEAANRFHVLDKMSEALEQQLLSQYQQVDWVRLRRENPAEFVAMQRDFEQSKQMITQAKQATIQQRTALEQFNAMQQEKAYQDHLAEQDNIVLQMYPSWADQAVRAKEAGEMRTFLQGAYGYTNEELNSINDFRQIQVIKDAMAFRQGQKVAEQKVQKPVPKFQKAGRPAADMAKMRDSKARKSALKSSGSVDAAAALLVDRM